jgi:hypothetical protein
MLGVKCVPNPYLELCKNILLKHLEMIYTLLDQFLH